MTLPEISRRQKLETSNIKSIITHVNLTAAIRQYIDTTRHYFVVWQLVGPWHLVGSC